MLVAVLGELIGWASAMEKTNISMPPFCPDHERVIVAVVLTSSEITHSEPYAEYEPFASSTVGIMFVAALPATVTLFSVLP
jgi:hypothetical protein